MEFVESRQIQFNKFSDFLSAKKYKIRKSLRKPLGVGLELSNCKFFRREPLGKFCLDGFINKYKITLNFSVFEHELNVAFRSAWRRSLELGNVILKHMAKIMVKVQAPCPRFFLGRFAGPG